MNYGSMIEYHMERKADLTIACLPVPIEQSRSFGVMEIDEDWQVSGFLEKPETARPMPDDPNSILASMGIYVFTTDVMYEWLCEDAVQPDSRHDFGHNIIPRAIESGQVFAYPFRDENRKEAAYWRDVGELDTYFAANMDLIQIDPVLNLYDEEWRIRTAHLQDPPPKFVFAEKGEAPFVRRGEALDSLVCDGSIVSGGRVERSILSRQVRVNSYAVVEDSILFEHVNVGRHAKIRRAIIDKGVHVPPGAEIGYDLEYDRRRGFTVTDEGVVVIAKNESIDSFMGARVT
jgi:glucose-1-phosphate adenylyltransferase